MCQEDTKLKGWKHGHLTCYPEGSGQGSLTNLLGAQGRASACRGLSPLFLNAGAFSAQTTAWEFQRQAEKQRLQRVRF